MKTLLVALDMTEGSRGALARALRIGAGMGAFLHVVHAVPSDRFAADGASVRQAVRQAVEEMIDALPHPHPGFSLRITLCDAKAAILDEARKIGADLIVLGAHGAPRFRDALFGTTATHVVRHSDRPVLVVREGGEKPYAKVLAALADMASADALLGAACAIAPQAEIYGVHAFDPPLGQILAGRDEFARQESRWEAKIEAALAKAVAGRPRRVSTKQHGIVEAGDLLTILMKETEALGPDLLAMGTRRRSTYLGSYAVDTLFWCPHDMLVVPEQAAAEVEAPTRALIGQ